MKTSECGEIWEDFKCLTTQLYMGLLPSVITVLIPYYGYPSTLAITDWSFYFKLLLSFGVTGVDLLLLAIACLRWQQVLGDHLLLQQQVLGSSASPASAQSSSVSARLWESRSPAAVDLQWRSFSNSSRSRRQQISGGATSSDSDRSRQQLLRQW